MKKILGTAILTGMMMTSTAFAAANPFEDVPENHWAYDAVAQLAKDGVVEGYGDGTYVGDAAITRYEMAQMVAKAMTKSDLRHADKAMVDKLAAEFADELNNLGVRVAKLEKKTDNLKFTGTLRYRYIQNRIKDEDNERNTAQYVTLRLEPSMQINEHWSGHARIDYNSDMDSAANTTTATVIPLKQDGEGAFEPGVRVERIWAQGDYKNFQVRLGKLPYLTNIDGGMIYDDNVSGGQITFGNKIKATLTAGRSARYDTVGVRPDLRVEEVGKTGSYQAIEIYNDRRDKFTWGLGFHRWSGRGALFNAASVSAVNIFDIGLGYKFDKNFSVKGAYAWTPNPKGEPARPLQPAEAATPNSKRAWSIEFDYKGANPADKGSWGAFVAYRQLGNYAVIAPTYDAMFAGNKGFEFGVDYVFMKNVMGTLKCFLGKETQDEYDRDDAMQSTARTIFGELNFFF